MKVLMVCLGNICRSPLAEGILKSKLHKLTEEVQVDSAGVIDYHQGEEPDHRAVNSANALGVDISDQRARKVQYEDFKTFDLILAMDKPVFEDLQSMAGSPEEKAKVHLFLKYSGLNNPLEVPDPYFQGPGGFDDVFKLIDDACERILDRWQMMGTNN
jgi:low molecular weight protein-tyrosine phosphatase